MTDGSAAPSRALPGVSPLNELGSDSPPWVLVVEDDREIARLIVQALVDEGYQVQLATSGSSALDAVRRGRFAAVVLDLLLPDLDGREVCRAIRDEGRRVHVMMVTALGEVLDRIQGLDLGADDYLAKPFSLDEFLARLRALVRRSQQLLPDILSAGPLRLDPASGRVWRGEEQFELTHREAALLEMFLRWPELVLRRDTIMAHVWGDEPNRTSNIVTQYIGHLRRKLRLPLDGSDLETIHGLGYRLTVRERG